MAFKVLFIAQFLDCVDQDHQGACNTDGQVGNINHRVNKLSSEITEGNDKYS